MNKKLMIAVYIVMAVLLSAVAAWFLLMLYSGAPSDTEAKKAISKLYAAIYTPLQADLKVVEILEKRKFNNQDEYWYVSAKVKGTLYQVPIGRGIPGTTSRRVNRVMDFTVFQDKNGNWKAKFGEPEDWIRQGE